MLFLNILFTSNLMFDFPIYFFLTKPSQMWLVLVWFYLTWVPCLLAYFNPRAAFTSVCSHGLYFCFCGLHCCLFNGFCYKYLVSCHTFSFLSLVKFPFFCWDCLSLLLMSWDFNSWLHVMLLALVKLTLMGYMYVCIYSVLLYVCALCYEYTSIPNIHN